MILEFPSGFYRTVIPPAPENEGNVTYTISGSPPPRGTLFFLKIANNLAVTSPPLIASEPQGDINSGTLTAYRNNTVVDREPRPIGSVLEFIDEYKTLDVRQEELNQTVDFPRFNDAITDPVNGKLLQAYQSAQQQLLQVSQSSNSKQIEVENLERLTNTTIASLQATEEALKIMPNDPDLLQAKTSLEATINNNSAAVDVLKDDIVQLDEQRTELSETIRRLSRVIS